MTNVNYSKGDLVKLEIPGGTYGTVVEVVNGTNTRKFFKKFRSFGLEDGTLVIEYMPGVVTNKRRKIVPYSAFEVGNFVSRVEDPKAEIEGLERRLGENLDPREKRRMKQALQYLRNFL